MYWINGERCDYLPANDRSVQFGDGCFTTAKIEQGQAALLSLHIQRLQKGVERLYLPQPDWQQLESHIRQIASTTEQGVLKVIISRGTGGRGYSAQGFTQPNQILSLSPYPDKYLKQRQKGLSMVLSPVAMGINPYLAGIKHLNRLEQILIKTFIEKSNADEALVLDTDGLLVECCTANIFWRKGKGVYTPDLRGCGVEGVMRERIIALLSESDYHFSCVSCHPETLADADEVMVCNSLMPVIPIREIQAHENQPGWQYQSRELYEYLLPECLKL